MLWKRVWFYGRNNYMNKFNIIILEPVNWRRVHCSMVLIGMKQLTKRYLILRSSSVHKICGFQLKPPLIPDKLELHNVKVESFEEDALKDVKVPFMQLHSNLCTCFYCSLLMRMRCCMKTLAEWLATIGKMKYLVCT